MPLPTRNLYNGEIVGETILERLLVWAKHRGRGKLTMLVAVESEPSREEVV